MADNYLEKRYREVFGPRSGFNAETGYNEQHHAKPIIPKIPKFGGRPSPKSKAK